MKQISLIIGLIFLVILIACDRPGEIILINKTDSIANYKIQIVNSSEKEIDYKIMSGNNNRVVQLFGLGHNWSDENIVKYIEGIQSVEIIYERDTIFLNEKDKIYKFYKDRRLGPWHKKIRIVLE